MSPFLKNRKLISALPEEGQTFRKDKMGKNEHSMQRISRASNDATLPLSFQHPKTPFDRDP